MNRNAENGNERHTNPWRIAAWALAALILLLPLIAMQFTAEVNWSVFDFAFVGALLLGVGLTFEITVRTIGDTAYRAAVAVALAAAFILVGMSASVGIIGRDGDPANLLYGGVLAVGALGALIARFRPAGMARALLATALAQALVAAVAIAAGLGSPWSGPVDLLLLNGFFVALFLGSALLFQKSAREQPHAR